jgi:hypothetical protein
MYLYVPVYVQLGLGRKRFRASLKTRDERVALHLAKSVIANWQNQIARARNEAGANDDIAIVREIFSKTGDEAESWRRYKPQAYRSCRVVALLKG